MLIIDLCLGNGTAIAAQSSWIHGLPGTRSVALLTQGSRDHQSMLIGSKITENMP
jgi:hypothetical protein